MRSSQISTSVAFLLAVVLLSVETASRASANPAFKPAPGFKLVDTDGKLRSLADYKGHTVILFFFCGCPWCADCGQAWGQMQRSGSLSTASAEGTSKSAASVTLIVYSGEAAEAKVFATTEGLDPHQTVLLPDPELKVTDSIYHSDICPRVFVIDASGNVRYTNNHSDDAARVAPALAIVSRALSAIRACPQPAALSKLSVR